MLKKNVKHIKIKQSFFLTNLIRLYCISPKIFSFIKYLIKDDPYIKRFKSINNPIIFHQNFQLGLFLSLIYNKQCIFDIHGFYYLQKENIENMRLRDRLFFYSNLIIENNCFKHGKYFSVASKETKAFLIKKYNIKSNNIFLAEEGYLDNLKENVNSELIQKIRTRYNIAQKDFIIFFAGTFKKLGGIFDLVYAYYSIYPKLSNSKLILLGSGQEESKILNFIQVKGLKNKIILINAPKVKMRLGELPSYQSLANIIVCPDKDNYYNQITPHIKMYDSLASGKPIILAEFKCLLGILRDFRGFELYKPGNIEDLAMKLEKIYLNYDKYSKEALNNAKIINSYTYQTRTKNFIQQIRSKFNK